MNVPGGNPKQLTCPLAGTRTWLELKAASTDSSALLSVVCESSSEASGATQATMHTEDTNERRLRIPVTPFYTNTNTERAPLGMNGTLGVTS
jgi:hypothetical protein